ncbi:MAG: penicillin amidase [Thermoleophilaceae bacterium]|nr:penicillin amidase [Thermoleophilaceae bacterium]
MVSIAAVPRRGSLIAIAAVVSLLIAAPADARIREAGTVLPPGQSGFVSAAGLATGTGSPHLTDQLDLFTSFRFKDAMLGQDSVESTESPTPGVTIKRDGYGVPSITGDTDYALWFGAGYAAAQDRLFQLDLFRRATQGRLAEILGKSYVNDDFIARRDFYTRPDYEAQFNRLPGDLRDRFTAYRDGINAWIAKTRLDPTKLPGEFAATGDVMADWTTYDSTTIGVYLARTVPSDDGAEIDNARALAQIGPKAFDKVLPIRLPDQVSTIPKSEGVFPSQPGRTVRQERAAFTRSQKFLKGVQLPPEPAPDPGAAKRATMAGIGRVGGSNMWAIRSKDGGATLFNGPQLGFQIPELFIEMELHGPNLNARGATAPGVPVLALGHNEHVAWGITSGLSDDDDLYVEKLAGDAEHYTYKGKTLAMDCRDETFTYRAQPTTPGADPTGSETRRICRTVHGPVQAVAGDHAFARKYAIADHEVDTLAGLADVNQAKDIHDVDLAADKLTWNENLMAADDQGNIGYWHPGLLALKPKNWDERLPYPGTGEAEWRGLLPPRQRPQVINPKQGYLFNWNNMPSTGWTQGDAPARERLNGRFHRAAWLARQVKAAHRRGGGFGNSKAVDGLTGTIAQQRPLASHELRAARKGATGDAATLLDVLLAWNGSYAQMAGDGTVDPGVAAWRQFKADAQAVAFGALPKGADRLDGGKGTSHAFDASNGDAYALRTLSPRGYRQAAKLTFAAMVKRFGTSDTTKWREPRTLYKPSAQGAGTFPEPFPFFDRGTFQHNTELGP